MYLKNRIALTGLSPPGPVPSYMTISSNLSNTLCEHCPVPMGCTDFGVALIDPVTGDKSLLIGNSNSFRPNRTFFPLLPLDKGRASRSWMLTSRSSMCRLPEATVLACSIAFCINSQICLNWLITFVGALFSL